MKQITILLLLFNSFFLFSQVLTNEERRLYNDIMVYRTEHGLTNIRLSASLTFVAQSHVKDLVINKPDLLNCNAHSWSSCCYTSDHANAECMWKKPSELTSYTGFGYEIACGSNDCCPNFVMTANYALKSWKDSKLHNAVILNESIWKNSEWKAIGIGIYKGFAVVWFGEDTDE